jgi:sulfoxide reductase catalytic subunit YedY
MPHIRVRRPWDLAASEITPEDVYLRRREFLRLAAGGTVGVAAALAGMTAMPRGLRAQEGPLSNIPPTPTADLYPAASADGRFTPGERHGVITDEEIVAAYNNFYEFTTDKEGVWELVGRFEARPWSIEVAGMVERPGTYDLEDLERTLPLQERIYRLRCVEAWSVVVPWIGFPLASLLDHVGVQPDARYVRFLSFFRPGQAPGQKRQTWYPWPYFEGLRMDEAMNDLAFMATGMYGHPLQKQNGAPIRLAVPWKYGYKSIKSIVRIELTDRQPPTFWSQLAAAEYSFLSNVDPTVPHPRWSQASEEIVGTGRRVPTLPYNGYGEWVASLYE